MNNVLRKNLHKIYINKYLFPIKISFKSAIRFYIIRLILY
jgi:hypothetical protein